MKQNKVLVIGGGASGLMAAIVAATSGAEVTLLEKNKLLGKKLRITGGGRCNIYNTEPNQRLLLQHYAEAEKYLYSAFHEFGNEQSKQFFADIGIDTKVEAKQRAFPVSERAEDVAEAMVKAAKEARVHLKMETTVTEIKTANGTISSIIAGGIEMTADTFILATGGASKPETGSTGDGFEWLRNLGHTVRPPTPTITPLSASDKWVSSLSGTKLTDVRISFMGDSVRSFAVMGDILCTHFGVSGPLILNNAHRVADMINSGNTVTAEIDCYPSLDHKQVDEMVQTALKNNPASQLKNVLKEFCLAGTSSAIMMLLPDIDFETKTSELNKYSRKTIVQTLKSMPVHITGLMGFEKAVVADGGISLDEVDMRTMRSKHLDNLFITGDLLDIRRPSGGFSLQLCWTTGYIAGKHSAKNITN